MFDVLTKAQRPDVLSAVYYALRVLDERDGLSEHRGVEDLLGLARVREVDRGDYRVRRLATRLVAEIEEAEAARIDQLSQTVAERYSAMLATVVDRAYQQVGYGDADRGRMLLKNVQKQLPMDTPTPETLEGRPRELPPDTPSVSDWIKTVEQRAKPRPAWRGMTKQEFAAKLAARTGVTKAKAAETIDAIFSTDSRKGIIAIELDAGREFTITGFGTWGTRNRKARMGRNPQTGALIHIPAMTVPTFRAGKGLKDRVRT